MDSNTTIRDAVKQTWWNYVLEPKDWREDFGLAPQNLYDILFCPKNGLSAYSYDSDCLLMWDNAEYLRKIFNEVKKRLSSDIIELINRGEKNNSVAISIVPADVLRFFNKDIIGKKKSLHIVYNGLDDYFYSDELEDLLKLTELKYFPVILSYWGRGKITNMIPCIKVSVNIL